MPDSRSARVARDGVRLGDEAKRNGHFATRARAMTTAWAAALLLTACGDPADGPARSDSAAGSGSGSTPAASAPAAGDGSGSGLAADDVAYLSRLGLIRGHLRVGIELYRDGHVMHAQSHMKHPGDELYSALEGAFAARGSEGFAAELDALATAVENEAGQADVEAAYESLLEAIAAAETHVDTGLAADASAQGAIIVNLLETAAEEYGIGVSADGGVTDVHEYQDAYGFTLTAGDRAEAARARVVERSDHAVLQTIADEIDSMARFWPELVPEGPVDVRPAALEEAVGRVRTEADRL